MTSFPLYAGMKSHIPSTDLTLEEKGTFVEGIKKLDDAGMELIAALIRAHQIETTSKRVDTSLPYSSTTNGDDIMFDLEALPIPLKHILSKFVKVHVASMKENLALVSSRTP